MATDTTTLKPGVTAHSNVHASSDLNATKAPVAVVAAEAPEAVVAAGTLGSACTTQAEHEKASCVTQNEEQPEVMHADLVAKTIDGFQTYCRVEKGLWPLQDKDTAPFVRAGGHCALLHSIMNSSPYLCDYRRSSIFKFVFKVMTSTERLDVAKLVLRIIENLSTANIYDKKRETEDKIVVMRDLLLTFLQDDLCAVQLAEEGGVAAVSFAKFYGRGTSYFELCLAMMQHSTVAVNEFLTAKGLDSLNKLAAEFYLVDKVYVIARCLELVATSCKTADIYASVSYIATNTLIRLTHILRGAKDEDAAAWVAMHSTEKAVASLLNAADVAFESKCSLTARALCSVLTLKSLPIDLVQKVLQQIAGIARVSRVGSAQRRTVTNAISVHSGVPGFLIQQANNSTDNTIRLLALEICVYCMNDLKTKHLLQAAFACPLEARIVGELNRVAFKTALGVTSTTNLCKACTQMFSQEAQSNFVDAGGVEALFALLQTSLLTGYEHMCGCDTLLWFLSSLWDSNVCTKKFFGWTDVLTALQPKFTYTGRTAVKKLVDSIQHAQDNAIKAQVEAQAEAQAKAQAEILAAAQQHQEENKALKVEATGLRTVLEQIKQTTRLHADSVEKDLWPLQDKDTAPFVRAGGHRALLHSIMKSAPYLSYYEVQAEAEAKAKAEFLAAAQQHQEENKALKAEVTGLRIVLEQIKQTTRLYADTFKTQDTSEKVV